MTALAAVVISIVLLGLAAGFFVTYTISVTTGLGGSTDLAYVEVFQAINRQVQNVWFAAFFFGALPVTALAALLTRGAPAMWWLLAAAALYAAGVLAVTFTANIPLNQKLAGYTTLTPDLAARARADFEHRWNAFNLVRTLASLGAFALATVSLAALAGVLG